VEYRYLGRTGLRISALALGCGNFGDMTTEDAAGRIMRRAIDDGVNLFDTADAYVGGESERIIGRFLRSTGQRDRVLIATKVYYPTGDGPNDEGLSRHHILRSCESSLRRLQTDHIDLYLTHRSASLVTPIEETLEALTDLTRQGKVCYVGCSTYPAWQILEALMVSGQRGYARFVVDSPPYNLLDRRVENERVPLCQKYGLGILPWSPLAMGLLAGRYPTDGSFPEGSRAAKSPQGIYAQRVNRRGARIGARVADLAGRYGLTAGQLALLWLKDQPGVTAPIVGPRTVEQWQEMVRVVDLKADDELRARFDDLNSPGTAVANFHNTSGWMKARIEEDEP
jgi:aryl-alcohol dehydrogenase-like predicted oxidoreductase